MPVRSLKDGTIQIEDKALVGATPNSVTVDLEEGDLSWTERTPVNIIKDRGVLSHARCANEEVFDVSFSMMFQSLSKHATTTPYDALKQVGGAAAWVSTEPKGDAYAVNLKFTITDPAGGASEEVFLEQFHAEEISLSEGEEFDTLTVSGRAQRNPLLRAQALWQANQYSGAGSLIDLTGNGHDAQLGSTAGADTNDPKWLSYAGEQYMYLPGIAANYASAPDSAALSITGDIDIQCRVALTDWTPSTIQRLVSKFTTTGNQRSYSLMVTATGALQLEWSNDGTAVLTETSSVVVSASDGDIRWVRATLDVSTGDVIFYTSTDTTADHTAVTWTQLGVTQTGSATSIFDSTAVLELGTHTAGATEPTTGKIYSAQVLNGIGGTVQFDADFTNKTVVASPFASFTEESSNAATVTFNRTATGRKLAVVDRPMFLLGTDDYFEVADHANLDMGTTRSFTVVAAGRAYGTMASNGVFVGKINQIIVAPGYALVANTSNRIGFLIAEGVNQPDDVTVATVSSGVAFAAAGVRNTGDDDLEAFFDGVGTGSPTTDSTTATLASSEVLRIGAASGGVLNVLDFEFFAAALFRSALSDEDVNRVGDEILKIKANS